MRPRERVEAALLHRWADQVPFTSYHNKLHFSQVERELRNDGLCLVDHRVLPYVVQTPNVSEATVHRRGSDGVLRLRRTLETPRGTLNEMYVKLPEHPRIPGELWPWLSEYLFKGPLDYPAIEFMIRNRRYEANHCFFAEAQEEAGDDVILMPGFGHSPLQEIMINIMGIEQFSNEWYCRRDDVMMLYDALTEDRRKICSLVAECPGLLAAYVDANTTPEVVGLDRFQEYILPRWDEIAQILHEHGKLAVVHLDANTRLLASAIAGSRIDVIEAFTPAPNSDMTVAEARAIWPDKVLWVNFPSSVHLGDVSRVEQATRQILHEAGAGDRLLVGITEAVPPEKWQCNFKAISRVLELEGRLPLGN